jgi:hypothetical protein
MILLRGIPFPQAQRCWCSSLQMAFSPKMFFFTIHEANMCGAPEHLTAFGARTFIVISQEHISGKML